MTDASCETNIQIETKIQNLGKCLLPSPLSSALIEAEETIPLFIDSEHIDELEGKEPICVRFEPAGPRKHIYFDGPKTKCAIVTCGGLCPGINDVIRAIVMESFHNYKVSSVLGIKYGLEGFIPHYGHDLMELRPDNVTTIHQFGGTILGSSRGPQSFSEIVDALERLNISILYVIGGDGTMKAMHGIAQEVKARNLKISVIGIPKTIDNDINFISQSFGFETAVDKAAEAILCAHTEALGYKNGVGLVKLMGRESGFIAAQATLAQKDVNFLLIPEIPFTLDGEFGLLPALEKRLAQRKHVVIVVAEGAGQNLMPQSQAKDASGNTLLTDIAGVLIREMKDYFAQKSIKIALKYIDPSYIIRAIPANANDKVYCGFLGQNAVHAAMAGKSNMVVAKIMDRYVHLPTELVIQKRRKLNPNSHYWHSVMESTGQLSAF